MGPTTGRNRRQDALQMCASSLLISSTSLMQVPPIPHRYSSRYRGDSRCVLCNLKGEAKELSRDHKPDDKLEKKRIEKAGGKVDDGRINCNLNLSRAIGDF